MTAEEVYLKCRGRHDMISYQDLAEEAMKEFAKYHVEEAIKAVHYYGKACGAMNDADLPYLELKYPLTNIK